MLEYIQDLHHVNYFAMYLKGLCTPYFICARTTISLWGDAFCIKWFFKLLLVPYNVWIFINGQEYLCFSSNIYGYRYKFLLHSQNPTYGHFEPLMLHSIVDSVALVGRTIGPCIFPYQLSHGQFDIFPTE